ncbi:MAG: hypothetical protein ACK55V_13760 [Alphaproteobacteria bacterium]|jgi:hypothetical protein
MDWLSGIPSTVLVALTVPIVLALAERAELKPIDRGVDGWFSLYPSITIMVVGVLTFLMASFFVYGALQVDDKFIFFSITAFLSTLGGCYLMFGFRVRYNAEGVEYRSWFKTIWARWDEIKMLQYHLLLGPRFLTKKGSFLAPRFAYGFRQLIDETLRQGVEVSPGFQRPPI